MTSVEIYIKIGTEFKRIDLFKDEKISLTSSVQNINDLSKVFTDYTQSFTIPASKNNNLIFNYWNESGINDGFDQRIRYDAIIELNTIPFKKGQIQIEKCNEKNNRIESYSITFYGKVKQLKDLFKEDKLTNLDYTSITHAYNATEVINRIDNTTNDSVYYPIVGNQHKYSFDDGGANDITIGGSLEKSVEFNDLFPAIPVSKVFEFIENKYNITFTSSLFDTSYWTELYLYCKNIEKFTNYSNAVVIDWNSVNNTFPELNLTTNKYYLKWTFADNTTNVLYQKTTVGITPTNVNIKYKLIMRIYDNPAFANGSIYKIFDNLIGVNSLLVLDTLKEDSTFANYTFEIQSLESMTFDAEMYNIKYDNTFAYNQVRIGYSATMNTISNINIGAVVPDIKVVDFFNGIIKLFNLTIIATSETSFNLEPLEFFYSYGKYIDINNYVINDSVDLERTKLFKKLTFTHEKSENVINNFFRNTFNRGFDYGDLIYQDDLSNESASYEIKTPFEDVMWEKTTGYDFITTSLIDKDLKPYKPKPILMYKNGLTTLTAAFKVYNGSGYTSVLDYQRFSNELFINNDIASLNFTAENSSWINSQTANNSLFQLWYKNYISALYDIRCRIIKLKAIIPIPMLSDIKLNDKLIYKDKKYIINTFTTDLTKGEVDLELISDFRELPIVGTGRFALKSIFNIDNTAQDLEVTILKLNAGYYDVEYMPTSYLSSNNYIDGTFIVPIDANTTGNIAFKQIEVTYHNPDIKQYINIIQDA
jgi:hypothetical protein